MANIKNIANAAFIVAGAGLIAAATIRGTRIYAAKKTMQEIQDFESELLNLTLSGKVDDLSIDEINEYIKSAKTLIVDLDDLPEMSIIKTERAIIKATLQDSIRALSAEAAKKEAANEQKEKEA